MTLPLGVSLKTETKKKLENFWYHHKIGVIITVTFVLIFAVCAVQMLNRTSYGLYALYAGPANINISADGGDPVYIKLENAIRQISGEKELECSIQCFTYVPDDLAEEYVDRGINYDRAQNQNTYSSFLTAIANGKDSILLLTPALYEEVKANGALASLEETFGYTPAASADGYGISLGDTDFYKFFDSLSDIPPDTVLCLRNLSNPSNLFGRDTGGEEWDKQIEIFKKIIEFEVN